MLPVFASHTLTVKYKGKILKNLDKNEPHFQPLKVTAQCVQTGLNLHHICLTKGNLATKTMNTVTFEHTECTRRQVKTNVYRFITTTIVTDQRSKLSFSFTNCVLR